MSLVTVILAAGKGTRMKSRLAKVLHRAAGLPLINYSIDLARTVGAARIVCVLGHQHEQVAAAIEERFGAGAVDVVLQLEQRGTGHAVQQAAPILAAQPPGARALLLYGDTPALTQPMLARLCAAADATLAMVTVELASPTGYGRVVRDEAGAVLRVVEEKDCTAAERDIDEVNAGIYCVDVKFLLRALADLSPNNAQGELYLTDVVARAATEGTIVTVEADPDEVMGVNDRVDLDRADRTLRRRAAERLMRAGVTIRQPESCRIDATVTVGEDSEIGSGVQLLGRTHVGANVQIDTGCVITDATIADGAHVKPYSVVSESVIGAAAQVGPFAHLRPGTRLGKKVKIGNFVETKKAFFDEGAKASHLSYLGDCEIGKDVNIGCGTITCNYDGFEKFKTVIEEGAFIGSDTQLVAPVRVGAGAIVGAGTTVSKDVPPGALALTRPDTRHVAGYAERKRKLREAKQKPGTPGA